VPGESRRAAARSRLASGQPSDLPFQATDQIDLLGVGEVCGVEASKHRHGVATGPAGGCEDLQNLADGGAESFRLHHQSFEHTFDSSGRL